MNSFVLDYKEANLALKKAVARGDMSAAQDALARIDDLKPLHKKVGLELTGNLRLHLRSKLLRSLIDLQKGSISPQEYELQLFDLIDPILESATGINKD